MQIVTKFRQSDGEEMRGMEMENRRRIGRHLGDFVSRMRHRRSQVGRSWIRR